MEFARTEQWLVTIIEFDPAYWCINVRVTNRKTRKRSFGYVLEAADNIVLDKNIGDISVIPIVRRRAEMERLFSSFAQLREKLVQEGAKLSYEKIPASLIQR